MTNKINLQDAFLEGIVKDYDNFTVLLKSQEKEQLIYKHAISTIQEGEKE